MSPAPEEPGEAEKCQPGQRGDDKEPADVVDVRDATAAHRGGREHVAEEAEEKEDGSYSGGGSVYPPGVRSGCSRVSSGHPGPPVLRIDWGALRA